MQEMITPLNLYMLQTVAEMGRSDIAEAMLRFGLHREEVEKLVELNPPQILEIAQSPFFLFTVDYARLSAAMDDEKKGTGYESMHQQITSLSKRSRREVGSS